MFLNTNASFDKIKNMAKKWNKKGKNISNWQDLGFRKSSAQVVLVSLLSRTQKAVSGQLIYCKILLILWTKTQTLALSGDFFFMVWDGHKKKPKNILLGAFNSKKSSAGLILVFGRLHQLMQVNTSCLIIYNIFWGKYKSILCWFCLISTKPQTREIETIHSKLPPKGTIGLIYIKLPASFFSKKHFVVYVKI